MSPHNQSIICFTVCLEHVTYPLIYGPHNKRTQTTRPRTPRVYGCACSDSPHSLNGPYKVVAYKFLQLNQDHGKYDENTNHSCGLNGL